MTPIRRAADAISRRPVLVASFVFFTGWAGDFWRGLGGWPLYGVVAGLILTIGAVLAIAGPQRRPLPLPLLLFHALAAMSVFWSAYPVSTALSAVVQVLITLVAAVLVSRLSVTELVLAATHALRWIVGLSYVFELIVSLVVRHPVLPAYLEPTEHTPVMLFWSRNELFASGQIQGIVGNSSLLAMAALLLAIASVTSLFRRAQPRTAPVVWLVVALVTLALTRAATIAVAATVVVVVGLIILLRSRRHRLSMAVAALAALAVAAGPARSGVLELLGKSADLTGRVGIWEAVWKYVLQRPVEGWGWVGYWPPWVEPLGSLATRNGVAVLHAHSAWLDVSLQLGAVGVVVFGATVAMAIVRSVRLAVRGGEDGPARLALALFLAAMLVQSLTESRMLIEGGWLTLVVILLASSHTPPMRRKTFVEPRMQEQ